MWFRVHSAPLRDDGHPDALARDLAGLTAHVDGAPGPVLLHSTSWRFAAGQLVVTYAAAPDLLPDETRQPVHSDAVVGSGDRLAPSPLTVPLVAVAAHACRHLAFLLHTDPSVAVVADGQPQLWAQIDRFRPAGAGLLASGGPRGVHCRRRAAC
ncbi:hypothetical protein Air01nite_41250 [Asanoa iriomotensis]|uniref:Uncharacterized protein n=2 Tax=Asanoa iriomotensis TaxID=234613 RepID=A0ABQ4C6U9_9ACTN|nr:hypothetical protein Air01nite_41250 [Asanoa iriomotensis]